MRFSVFRGRNALFGIIGVLMILFVLGTMIEGKWPERERAAAASVVIDETKTPENTAEFTLEILSVVSPARRARRVFLYHTHTYEAYEMDTENPYIPTEKWRTADSRYNVIRVGEELTARLREAGVMVTHDTTAYEVPKLSTAYSRSLEGLRRAAEEGYDLYIDLHRDSYSQGNGANAVSVGGKNTARMLILIGQGTGTGFDEKPDWRTNAAAAQMISDGLNAQAEGLCRGVSLKSGRYNQQVTTPCLLIEVGNNKNTLPEAVAAMDPLAQAICRFFDAGE